MGSGIGCAVPQYPVRLLEGWDEEVTLPWFLAVHLPVPVVVGLRILSKLGWRLTTLPVLVGSFFLGQLLGGKIHQWWEWRKDVRGN
jgi:hypothetical protein